MDANPTHDRHSGGTIEPAAPAPVQPLRQAPTGERYELRDPFAEVIYHAKTLDEMITKADRVGAIRFHAIGPNGERTQVMKIQGAWQFAEKPEPARIAQQETQPGSNVVPLTTEAPVRQPVDKPETRDERATHVEQLHAALKDRYHIRRLSVQVGDTTIGRTEYRYRGDTTRVAFTESTFKLATDTSNPSVGRSMVDVAEARNWRAIRVTGSEDFKRTIWLEASLRGIKAHGYEPTHEDQQLLHREREARQPNRIEPARQPDTQAGSAAGQSSVRGNGGRKAVIAALEAVLVARRVPPKTRERVLAAAAENLAQRLRSAQAHKVKVFDRAAPSQRPTPVRVLEPQRARDRSAPAR